MTYRTNPNTLIQIIGGLGKNRDLVLQNEGNNTEFLTASNGFYLGVNLAKTILLGKTNR